MNPSNAIELKHVLKSFNYEVEDKTKKSNIIVRNPTKTVVNNVINDVSLEIRKGDVLGVLGRNGSGKSTLLSLIARIMEPDSGTIERSGKVAAILELGMGFHADMSGRDNIYLKAELYGFSKKQIDQKIDSIIEYSGIAKYIDNPVRTYSSGMSARLAFSIMVNVDSEIILVDEVLSVGDYAFSSKAKQHFKQMADKGRTIVLVSHSLEMIESICNRVIWLENGSIIRDGNPKAICSEYQRTMYESPEIIVDLALNGVSEAQYRLAMLYKTGAVFDRDIGLYENWIKQAAIQGHVRAQVEYADYLLENGQLSDAIGLYQSAANKGDSEAKKKIATLNSSRDEITDLVLSAYSRYIQIDGSPMSLFYFADLLLKTSWTFQDYRRAFEYFLKSAEGGIPDAIHQVALMYRDGLGVSRDYSAMLHYLLRASELGFPASITLLADLFSQGRLIDKDEKKAFIYVEKAANLGIPSYMYRLAEYYRDGIGIDKDLKESERWFKRFSQSNIINHKVRALSYLRSILPSDRETYNKILNSTIDNALNSTLSELVSYSYLNGSSTYEYINKLATIASESNSDAMRRLGNYYYDGIGVEKDLEKAFMWYRRGAKFGDMSCVSRLGEMFRDGKGTPADLTEAIRNYLIAARLGNAGAVNSIVTLCESHPELGRDPVLEAIGILSSMAEGGNSDAMRRLGNYYYDGIGVEKDLEKAFMWYRRGAKFGDFYCIEKIKSLGL